VGRLTQTGPHGHGVLRHQRPPALAKSTIGISVIDLLLISRCKPPRCIDEPGCQNYPKPSASEASLPYHPPEPFWAFFYNIIAIPFARRRVSVDPAAARPLLWD